MASQLAAAVVLEGHQIANSRVALEALVAVDSVRGEQVMALVDVTAPVDVQGATKLTAAAVSGPQAAQGQVSRRCPPSGDRIGAPGSAGSRPALCVRRYGRVR